jgi:hypothetical protein
MSGSADSNPEGLSLDHLKALQSDLEIMKQAASPTPDTEEGRGVHDDYPAGVAEQQPGPGAESSQRNLLSRVGAVAMMGASAGRQMGYRVATTTSQAVSAAVPHIVAGAKQAQAAAAPAVAAGQETLSKGIETLFSR